MRKLTVLLLSGAILAITGGVSVVRADGFAILRCLNMTVSPAADTSFDTPEECAEGNSCSKCVDAFTERGLTLADVNQSRGNLPIGIIHMIFAESDDDEKDKHKHRGRDKDED